MRLLLDTHILPWVMTDDRQLGRTARRLLADAESILVSSVSIWEIAIKRTLGKLHIDEAVLDEQIARVGFEPLAVTWEHARTVRGLPPHHRDPFDRMLVAQAMSEPLRLLTHDASLRRYSELVTVV